MYCPRPGKTTKTQNVTPPGKKTVNAPPPRTEGCNASASEVITDPNSGGSTETIINVPGPAGPPGLNGLSWFWRGEWGDGATYETADLAATVNNERIYDIVSSGGATYICIKDHTSAEETKPGVGADWHENWSLVTQTGSGGAMTPSDKNFFDTLKDDVFDWIKNASIGELLAAGVAVAGIVWAGSKIIDMISDDGGGDGDADQRYDGSDGFVLAGYTPPDIKQVISSLCDYSGIVYDVSALPDAACEFTIGNATAVRSILATLALAYQFDMTDTGGVLRFVPRSATPVKTLTDDDLAFTSNIDDIQSPYSAQRLQGTDLPRKVILTYPDSNLDYDTFTQESDLFVYEQGQEVTLNVPVTLNSAQAKRITELTLMNSHLERQTYTFSTGYANIALEPADVIMHEKMGLLRIKTISEINEGVIQIEATDAGAEQAVEGSNLTPTLPPASSNIPLQIGYSQGLFIDPQVLNDQDSAVRVYVAVHGFNKPGWPGAAIYMSENNGASYDQVGSTFLESTIGIVAAVTPSADHYIWDNTTTISVQLKTNTLGSVSELDVLQGKNWCMIGQEIIGFKNAVLTAPMTYTLSGLLRGREGSWQYVSRHVANELFVLLDDTLVRLEYSDANRGTIKKYKVVTMGSSIDKVAADDVQMYSNNTLCWPVTNTKILQTGSDWTLSWRETVRFNNQIKDFTTAFHDQDWGGYGIVIYDTDGVTVKNTYTTQSETWTYSATMQTNDFGAVQTTLKTSVAQLSTKFGAGYPVSLNS